MNFKQSLSKLLIIFTLLVGNFFLLNYSASAQSGSYNFVRDSGLNASSAQAGYEDRNTTVEQYIANIINIILSLLGVIFLAFTIYGGLIWMTAQGNEERVKKARELITESVIGVIIVLAAYAITYFVLKNLMNISLIS